MKSAKGTTLRRVGAGIVGTLAVVLLLASALAVWARNTAFNSEKVADLVSNALAEPEVSAALADYLTEQVAASVELDTVVSGLLPASLQRLEPAIVGGIEGAVSRGINAVLATPAVEDLLHGLVERAHGAAMQLLDEGGLADGISVDEGVVTVNLVPLVVRGIGRVQELGLLENIDLPTATADGDPAEQIADLEAALGRDLPDDFAQLVVYQSDTLAEAQASLQSAQDTFALVKRAIWLLLVLTVVLVAAAVLIAPDRWRAAMLLGLGVVVAMTLARVAVRRVRDEAPELVARPGAKAAVTSLLEDASVSLLRVLGILLAAAIVVVALAFLRRGRLWRDLAPIVGVGAGVVTIAVIGLSIGSLVLAVIVAVLAALAVVRFGPSSPPSSTSLTSPSSPPTAITTERGSAPAPDPV